MNHRTRGRGDGPGSGGGVRFPRPVSMRGPNAAKPPRANRAGDFEAAPPARTRSHVKCSSRSSSRRAPDPRITDSVRMRRVARRTPNRARIVDSFRESPARLPKPSVGGVNPPGIAVEANPCPWHGDHGSAESPVRFRWVERPERRFDPPNHPARHRHGAERPATPIGRATGAFTSGTAWRSKRTQMTDSLPSRRARARHRGGIDDSLHRIARTTQNGAGRSAPPVGRAAEPSRSARHGVHGESESPIAPDAAGDSGPRPPNRAGPIDSFRRITGTERVGAENTRGLGQRIGRGSDSRAIPHRDRGVAKNTGAKLEIRPGAPIRPPNHSRPPESARRPSHPRSSHRRHRSRGHGRGGPWNRRPARMRPRVCAGRESAGGGGLIPPIIGATPRRLRLSALNARLLTASMGPPRGHGSTPASGASPASK